MRLVDILRPRSENKRLRRTFWPLDYFVREEFDEELEENTLYDNYGRYRLSPEDILSDDWVEMSNIGYVALYMQDDGIPGHYVINEEEYNNKQWPDLPYMTDWIRFEGK